MQNFVFCERELYLSGSPKSRKTFWGEEKYTEKSFTKALLLFRLRSVFGRTAREQKTESDKNAEVLPSAFFMVGLL